MFMPSVILLALLKWQLESCLATAYIFFAQPAANRVLSFKTAVILVEVTFFCCGPNHSKYNVVFLVKLTSYVKPTNIKQKHITLQQTKETNKGETKRNVVDTKDKYQSNS